MTLSKLKFNISLIALLVYELAMLVFQLDGLSLGKLLLTGLVWISFFMAFTEYVKKIKLLRKRFPWFAFAALSTLIGWNIIGLLRSVAAGDGTVTTLLGNVNTSLALLLPFVIIFSAKSINLGVMHRYFITVLKIAVPTLILFYISTGGAPTVIQVRMLLVLFLPAAFLIPLLPFIKKKERILILISALLLGYAANLYGQRTMMIREFSLFLGLIAVYIYGKYNFKWLLPIAFLTLLLPIALLYQGITTGESPLETYLSSSLDSDLKTDTRTFLYKELYTDLESNNQLLTGKGANGSYYSDYFSNAPEESAYRNTIEVGVLGILLKGGFIAVFLNLCILVLAIFFAFFRANNTFVTAVGFILIAHTILLFIENYYNYSGYNYAIWFCIGVCLSKEIRYMTNADIRTALYPKKKIE